MKKNFKNIIQHLINQNFFLPNSEIYGGLANTWDYGPLGVELKRNLENFWWNYFVKNNDAKIIGMDTTIISNPKIWEASGHLDKFQDPLIDCKNCKKRYRFDKLIKDFYNYLIPKMPKLDNDKEIKKMINDYKIVCPNCSTSNFTNLRHFNLMFKTAQGTIENTKRILYLRPETSQNLFINFNKIIKTHRLKIPFGIGQIGKSFRNEITPGNFIFRTYEFTQMEIGFFVKPEDNSYWFKFWLNKIEKFLEEIGIKKNNYYLKYHSKNELAHYSKKTCDIEYNFPFGKKELWGLSDRSDFDLKNHQKHSGINLQYFDDFLKTKYFPYIIEPSVGVERLLLAILCEAYHEDVLSNRTERIWLDLPWNLAPFQIGVLPLTKKQSNFSQQIYKSLNNNFKVVFDEKGTIGKRYRRLDAIGVKYCITVDYDSEKNQQVTIRNCATMEQEVVPILNLKNYFIK